ncbi:type II toxin-antitoxin system VapC family toxin (plasmid) [Agrobacterium salinitolerans]|uniref:type II toxin-antitoxin system VapC family toxin n=1 Tax=Agrobacterium salinitolerans TaxID=1183413 RepID=UPI001C23AED8|nr:type II toxin-antitoxin system VapC family toxin [Agrobacterium salinitolerans]QXC52815.1 type II toxin-antitoxin system VapC family toxin [Agrobacterium salinitolerans]
MRLLLVTNVLSEVTKPRPDEAVLKWIHGLDEDRTFISIVSIAEIRRGVALMDAGRKRDALDEWLTYDLPQRFENRIIPVEGTVALAWGDRMALAKRCGRGLASMDGLIAATAVAHQLTLATRNTKDFEGFGIDIIAPWTA